MAKCIEINKGNGKSKYECPVCHQIFENENSCNSHVYKKHRDWAHKDTQQEIEEYKDKSA